MSQICLKCLNFVSIEYISNYNRSDKLLNEVKKKLKVLFKKIVFNVPEDPAFSTGGRPIFKCK